MKLCLPILQVCEAKSEVFKKVNEKRVITKAEASLGQRDQFFTACLQEDHQGLPFYISCRKEHLIAQCYLKPLWDLSLWRFTKKQVACFMGATPGDTARYRSASHVRSASKKSFAWLIKAVRREACRPIRATVHKFKQDPKSTTGSTGKTKIHMIVKYWKMSLFSSLSAKI